MAFTAQDVKTLREMTNVGMKCAELNFQFPT